MLKTREENPDGFHMKYIISRVDGTPVEPENVYLVLKLEGDGDPVHMEACRKAALTYANEIKEHLPVVARDLQERYNGKG